MSKKQVIKALADRYVDRRFGACMGNAAMRKAAFRGAIRQYASNWLAQHGALPDGQHTCRFRASWAKGNPVTVKVNFTRLLREPDYPESELTELRRVHQEPSR